MNLLDLREAQARFETAMPSIIESRKKLHDIRKAFVKYYTPARIQNLHLDKYALGNDRPADGSLLFCYTLEQTLDGLGRILPARASRFGVYWGKTEKDKKTKKYRFTKKYGRSVQEAYNNIRNLILKLLVDGKRGDLDAIIENPISPTFKGKLLSTYYPTKYLNIFSDVHLNHFLTKLNLDSKIIYEDAVLKREELLRFKNNDPIMRDWSIDIFAHFLYRGYPFGPKSESDEPSPELDEYRDPVFPANPTPEIIDLTMLPAPPIAADREEDEDADNADYEKKARRLKKYGDRGEKIVKDLEVKKLLDANLPVLAAAVDKAKKDSLGYDILSFEMDGTPRYIEVKATSSKAGSANFFLSRNEFKKAKILKNYHVYVVFEILSSRPKIWQIGNPFHPENEKVKLTTQTYRVEIRAK